MMDLDKSPKHGEKMLAQRIDDSTVLLSLDNGEYYALDEIGSRIWGLCDGTHSVSDIIESICAEYDAPPETIKVDVLELLEELVGEKILV